jgi:hypothetical protein
LDSLARNTIRFPPYFPGGEEMFNDRGVRKGGHRREGGRNTNVSVICSPRRSLSFYLDKMKEKMLGGAYRKREMNEQS